MLRPRSGRGPPASRRPLARGLRPRRPPRRGSAGRSRRRTAGSQACARRVRARARTRRRDCGRRLRHRARVRPRRRGRAARSDDGRAPAPLPPGAVLVGARFRPGAGGPALGLPLNTLLDQRVEVAALHPGLAPRLDGGLSPARALDGILAVAAELVTARPPDRLVGHAAHLLASPTARVEALARELALSERQLRRRFEAAIGYGPKTLQRVLRFRRFLARVDADEDPPDLASAAADAGYADQAHLTRESTRLSGLPPAALVRARRPATPGVGRGPRR